jgi:polyribonucleotide nucleotidyltransferase
MFPKAIVKSFNLPDGREVSIETGRMARQADGSVILRMGKTMMLATVVASKDPRDVDFLPLSVDYQEKFASSGKIPGGFLKREGRLSDREILISRLVDRALRPLFPDNYHFDTQVMLQLISADQDAQPDALAALAASAAIAVSNIPFGGPISEVRVVKHNGEFIVNPAPAVIEEAELNVIVAATADNIMMVEGQAHEVPEADILEAMKVAHEAIKVQVQAQLELAEMAGATEKREVPAAEEDEELNQRVHQFAYSRFYDVVRKGNNNKAERKAELKQVREDFMATIGEDEEVNEALVKKYLNKAEKAASRNLVLETKQRLDGRQLNEIRPIWSEVDFLPSAHGSAVFTRGETQSLTSVTLGTKMDEQMIDGAMVSGTSKFILHYNFPGFSTGEVRPNRVPGRREVGHGNLAHRALEYMLPSYEDSPYTIRVVSDILESNGSSSMATVCAGSLALMDAGLQIKAPVSGIAMGMISDSETGNYAILSDILGDEDHLGDMDFKITGTKDGITACQMDIKVDGLSYEVLNQALEQAKEGRLHILGEMAKTLEAPRPDMKPHAPRSTQIEIERDMIGAIIGPGGKVVQEIQATTNTVIAIDENERGGVVNIFATNDDDMQAAVTKVRNIVAMPEVGETYMGKVKTITPFGAFLEFMPGKEGLLHISEISWERTESMDGVMEIGEEVKIKLTEVDPKTKKYRLSRKVLLPKPEGYQERPPRERREGGRDDRGGRDGGRRDNDRGRDRDRGDRGGRDRY